MDDVFTFNNQNVIPLEIIRGMGLKNGDKVMFKKHNGGYYLHKVSAGLNLSEPGDTELKLVADKTFAEEWLSPEDEEAFKNL